MENKKHCLLQSAHQVFREHGYKDTNISEIAKRAGIAVGSFYKYYSSKEEIFLEIYVQENNAVRNDMIRQIDWSVDPSEVIESMFNFINNNVSNNKILAEWSNNNVSELLHGYYMSNKGKNDYPFNQFLQKTLFDKLKEKHCPDDKIKDIIKVYDFIYYIDCNVTNKQFNDYTETLRTLTKYFIKGVFSDI